ncbi:hypothetical protein ACJMK2_029175, partial [Sinanodonta woodiana]
PSAPQVTARVINSSTIVLNISKGNGLLTQYKITSYLLPKENGSRQNVSFIQPPINDTVMFPFTTSDAAGSCFQFSIIAISGLSVGASNSNEFVINETCY